MHFRAPLALIGAAMGALWMLSVTVRAEIDGPAQVQLGESLATDIPVGKGSDILRRRCLRCHAIDLIAQQRLSRAGWERELAKMIGWGAAVDSLA